MHLRSSRLVFCFLGLIGITQLNASLLSLTADLAVRVVSIDSKDDKTVSNQLAIRMLNISDGQLRVPTGCMEATVREDGGVARVNITIPERSTPEGANIPWSESALDIVVLKPGEAALIVITEVALTDYSLPIEINVRVPEAIANRYDTVCGEFAFSMEAYGFKRGITNGGP